MIALYIALAVVVVLVLSTTTFFVGRSRRAPKSGATTAGPKTGPKGKSAPAPSRPKADRAGPKPKPEVKPETAPAPAPAAAPAPEVAPAPLAEVDVVAAPPS
jgi:hypothetical protein